MSCSTCLTCLDGSKLGDLFSFLFSAISPQHNVLDNQHASISSDQTHEGVEETTVLIVDKIINVSEVTCEKVETYTDTNQEKLAVQNFGAESDQGVHPDDGKTGHLNSAHLWKGESQEKLHHVHLKNVEQVSVYSQVIMAYYCI